jgi:hypothetical protein
VGLTITYSNNGANATLVGDINEYSVAKLGEVESQIADECTFHLAGISSITSSGVLPWMKFMKSLASNHKITFAECSPTFVDQMNMIPSFHHKANIVSVYRHYSCDGCGIKDQLLMKKGEHFDKTGSLNKSVPCPKCGGRLHYPDFDEDYFIFALSDH